MSRYYRHNPDEPVSHDWTGFSRAQCQYDAQEHPDYNRKTCSHCKGDGEVLDDNNNPTACTNCGGEGEV